VNILAKRLSEDRRYLVTWDESNRLYAWEKGTEQTHRQARPSGWARVDTKKPDRLPDPRQEPGEHVGTWNDSEVEERRRARAIIYSLFPEVYSRSMPSRGAVVAFSGPEQCKALYDDDVRRKRSGAKPPAEALSGAGAGPGGLAAVEQQ